MESKDKLLATLTRLTGLSQAVIEEGLRQIVNPGEAAMPEACRMKTCDYYMHYLVYHDPAKHGPRYDHLPFHAAVEKCLEWQKRSDQWYAEHPKATSNPRLDKMCEEWERRVCA